MFASVAPASPIAFTVFLLLRPGSCRICPGVGADAERGVPGAGNNDRATSVTTIGERIGKRHLSPAQGASAELVGAVLIGTAGFSDLPVSTTHIIASGVCVQKNVIGQIVIAWVATLPASIVLSGAPFWLRRAAAARKQHCAPRHPLLTRT
jgi:hypothetical protein